MTQRHNLQIFGVIPFVELQNDTYVCVIINKRSFESFMCLDLVSER